MRKEIIYEMVYSQSSMTYEIAVGWCQMGCMCFTPTTMGGRTITGGKSRKYREKIFFTGIKKEFESGLLSIRLTTASGDMLVVARNVDIPEYYTFLLTTDVNHIVADFDSYFEQMMVHGGIVAHKCSLEDNFWQNADNLEYYRAKGRNMKGIKTTFSPIFPNEEIVDIEFNPGHEHHPLGIWFGSCHQMWFGKNYSQYIKTDKLKEFKDCSENVILQNDVIRITLYGDIWAYDKPENRRRQLAFRTQVGIDVAAHMLKKNTPSDPWVEIQVGRFLNGGIRRINHYYDTGGMAVPKSMANKVVSVELSECGEVLHQQEKSLG